MAANCTDEGDTHHPGFQFRRRRVFFGNREAIKNEEVDVAFDNRIAEGFWQIAPNLFACQIGLQDECATINQSTKRIGVREDLMIRRNDHFHIFQIRVGDLHRFRAEGDIIVGWRTAFLRAIFRCGFGIKPQGIGENIGEQFACGNRAIPTDGVEANTQGTVWQQLWIALGFKRHRFRFRIGCFQFRLQIRNGRTWIGNKELAAKIHERLLAAFHILIGRDQMPWLQIMSAEAEDGRCDFWHCLKRRNAWIAFTIPVLNRLHQAFLDEGCQGGHV